MEITTTVTGVLIPSNPPAVRRFSFDLQIDPHINSVVRLDYCTNEEPAVVAQKLRSDYNLSIHQQAAVESWILRTTGGQASQDYTVHTQEMDTATTCLIVPAPTPETSTTASDLVLPTPDGAESYSKSEIICLDDQIPSERDARFSVTRPHQEQPEELVEETSPFAPPGRSARRRVRRTSTRKAASRRKGRGNFK